MNCTYCDAPATKFCRAHNRYLCERGECAGYHRVAFRPELCRVVDPDKWDYIDKMVALGAAIVILTGLIIAGVHGL